MFERCIGYLFYLIGFCIFSLLVFLLPKVFNNQDGILFYYFSWRFVFILLFYVMALSLIECLYKMTNKYFMACKHIKK